MDDDATKPNRMWHSPAWCCRGTAPRPHLSRMPLFNSSTLPDDDLRNEAYASYLDQLTEINHKRALAASRGKTAIEAISSHSPEWIHNQAPFNSVNTVSPDEPVSHVIKRAADHPDRPSLDLSPDSMVNESLYVWSGIPVTTAALDPSVSKTLALKANYLVDIRRAKNNLIVRLDCPDFPDTLWNDVLLNRYVDLDRVYAGYYTLEADTWHTQSIGNVDIMVNHAGISPKTSKSFTHMAMGHHVCRDKVCGPLRIPASW